MKGGGVVGGEEIYGEIVGGKKTRKIQGMDFGRHAICFGVT